MRRAHLLVCILVVFSLLLASCTPAPSEGNGGEEAKPTASPTQASGAYPSSEKRKVVYFVGFGTGTAPSQVEGQQALISKFNDSHPDIEVELMIVPHEEAIQRFTAMCAGGNPPEVIGAAGFATIGILGDTGVIEDLTPFMERSEFDTSIYYGPVVGLMEDFFPEGRPALPFGIYPSMVFYNEDAFDAAGLEYPPHDYESKEWTYERIHEYGLKLTLDRNGNDASSRDFDPDQIAQWGFDDSWTDMRNYLAMWGAPGVGLVTDPEMKKAIINQPEWVRGLQWLSDGIWQDHFIPDAAGQATYENVGNGDPFSSGLVAMFLTHTWYMPEGLTGISFRYDIAPVPASPSGKRIVRSDVDGFAMVKGADEQEAAWEFMSWLVQPEQIVDVCLVYGALPPVRAVEAEFRGIMEEKWPGLDYDVIYDGLNYLDNPHSDAYVVEQQKIAAEMNNALTLVYSGKEKEAQKILDDVNATVQKILDEYWASKE